MSGELWTPRVRERGFALGDPVAFRSAVLVENYLNPHTLMLGGLTEDLTAAAVPGTGLVLDDPAGTQRFAGFLWRIEQTGLGTTMLTYRSDLARIWYRLCWPKPQNPWTNAGQDIDYDVITAPVETRILSYISRNAGSTAYQNLTLTPPQSRRVPTLRLPASGGRGASGKTSARFNLLGQLVADLAESANLDVDIVQTYEGGTPFLDVQVIDTVDLTEEVRFGIRKTGNYHLGPDWRYAIEMPAVSTALSAAGGLGAARILNSATDGEAENLWDMRVEGLVDQRDTTDAAEITDGLTQALLEGAGPTEVVIPIADNDLLGTVIPLGAKVVADFEVRTIPERLRQVTTTIGGTDGGGRTKTVSGVMGSPEAPIKSLTQRQLVKIQQALHKLQRS